MTSKNDHILKSLHWLKLQARIEYKVMFTTYKLLLYFSRRYLCDSSQFSLLDPFDHLHWSLFSNQQFIPVLRSQIALFCMLHLTRGANFLLLFVFLISQVHHHHPALLHRHALTLDRLLTFRIRFSSRFWFLK